MSLHINPDEVAGVLLADHWHQVLPGTFDLDSYEYVTEDGDILHGGGNSGVCSTGFSFVEVHRATGDDESYEGPSFHSRIYGPLTAIIAVREKWSKA
ncbi:MAG: hypothetical protein ACOH2F_13075 [Cellulomonas sp.]